MTFYVERNASSQPLPDWASNDAKIYKKYLQVHQKTWLDRLVIWIANRMGIIVNGKMTQDQVEKNLNKFDIAKLLNTGTPFKNHVLSEEAQKLILNSFADFNAEDSIIDTHLHILAYDEGNYLNPSILKGFARFKFTIIHAASGVDSVEGSTKQATQRLYSYAERFPKLAGIILPIEKAYTKEGLPDWEHTGSYLHNDVAINAATSFTSQDSRLYAACSIHPNDPEWETKMEEAHSKGIRVIKWMPPQGINPSQEDYIPFYKKIAELEMILLAHAGPEHAIPGPEEWEDFGNPLRFRNALIAGANVILAHSGHRDMIADLDHPEKKVQGHELYARLAREAVENEWAGTLYADISAVHNHYGPDFVTSLLKYAQEKGFRFLHGSDFPYTNMVAPGNDPYPLLAKHGLLTKEMVSPLKEIRNWNPLLANFVSARCLAYNDLETGKVLKFPKETFTGKFKNSPVCLYA